MESKFLEEIRGRISEFVKKETPLSQALWAQFVELHPADIAQFLSELEYEDIRAIYLQLPKQLKTAVFIELSNLLKVFVLSFLDDGDRTAILSGTPLDDLTDLFDEFSDEELEKYLTLLRKKDRDQVLSLMQFGPESAGGIMEVNVWNLVKDFTVEKSIQILRRLQAERELHREIYVTTQDNILVGHILLEDLVLKDPQTRIGEFMRKNELVVRADQDQEEVAREMLHYKLSIVPVVGDQNHFLGVISSDKLAEVLEKEATEDVYKLSAIRPMKQTYLDTPFFRLVFERGYILVILLLAESISGIVLRTYEDTIKGILMLFIPMLMSTGGNTSHQTSALVIRGIQSGEISSANVRKFWRREFLVAATLAFVLSVTAFVRAYLTSQLFWPSLTVSLACAIIVMTSITLGSTLPIALKKLRIDPMFSAGPTLATIMDVLSVIIFCYIGSLLIG